MLQNSELPGPREVPGDLARGMSAQDAIIELLRRQRAQAAELVKRVESEQSRADRLAERVALDVYKKRRSDQAAAFRGITEILGEEGVTLITHEGEPLTAALEEASDIFEWLPAVEPGPERVLEAFEPEIRRDGRLIHRAKLSCMQAAPDEPDVGETAEVPSPPDNVASLAEAASMLPGAVSAPEEKINEVVPLFEYMAPVEAAPTPRDAIITVDESESGGAMSAEAETVPEGVPLAENATGTEGRAAAPWYDWIVQKTLATVALAKTGTGDVVRKLKDLLNTVRGGKKP